MKSPALAIARRDSSAALRGGSFWFALAASAALAAGLAALLRRLSPVAPEERAARLVETLLLATPPLAVAASAGSFARERAARSLETLLSAPVSDAQAVIGKFLSSLALCTGGTFAMAAFAAFAAGPLGFRPPDAGEIALAAAGLAAVAAAQAAWCACGVFFSLLARRESGAAAPALAAAAASAVAAAGELPFAAPDGVLAHLDLVQFAVGVADTRPLFAFLSAAAFFLFASVRLLESRFWLVSGNP